MATRSPIINSYDDTEPRYKSAESTVILHVMRSSGTWQPRGVDKSGVFLIQWTPLSREFFNRGKNFNPPFPQLQAQFRVWTEKESRSKWGLVVPKLLDAFEKYIRKLMYLFICKYLHGKKITLDDFHFSNVSMNVLRKCTFVLLRFKTAVEFSEFVQNCTPYQL